MVNNTIEKINEAILSIANIMKLDISKEAAESLEMVLAELQDMQFHEVTGNYTNRYEFCEVCPATRQISAKKHILATQKTDASDDIPDYAKSAGLFEDLPNEFAQQYAQHKAAVMPEHVTYTMDELEEMCDGKQSSGKHEYDFDSDEPVGAQLYHMFMKKHPKSRKNGVTHFLKGALMSDLNRIGVDTDSDLAVFLKNACNLDFTGVKNIDNIYSVERELKEQLNINLSANEATSNIDKVSYDLSKSEFFNLPDYKIGSMYAIDLAGTYCGIIGQYLNAYTADAEAKNMRVF